MQSNEPITASLKSLMREHGLTYRALATLIQTRDHDGRGVTHVYLCGLASGREHPSRRSLELIAVSLGLEPTYFPEYRLAELRRQLNEREVGFRAAWARYDELVS